MELRQRLRRGARPAGAQGHSLKSRRRWRHKHFNTEHLRGNPALDPLLCLIHTRWGPLFTSAPWVALVFHTTDATPLSYKSSMMWCGSATPPLSKKWSAVKRYCSRYWTLYGHRARRCTELPVHYRTHMHLRYSFSILRLCHDTSG